MIVEVFYNYLVTEIKSLKEISVVGFTIKAYCRMSSMKIICYITQKVKMMRFEVSHSITENLKVKMDIGQFRNISS
jgi:DNA-directed RNA polymerase subunit L